MTKVSAAHVRASHADQPRHIDGTPVPCAKERMIIADLMLGLGRDIHGRHYRNLRFLSAWEKIPIVCAIMRAQIIGNPLSTSALAEHVQMPRATLSRCLRRLQATGLIIRIREGRCRLFIINNTALETYGGDEAVRRMAQMIINAGKNLAKM